MENKERYSEFARKVIQGVKIAHQKMIHEKVLKGENIVIADADGQITTISARELTTSDRKHLFVHTSFPSHALEWSVGRLFSTVCQDFSFPSCVVIPEVFTSRRCCGHTGACVPTLCGAWGIERQRPIA